MRRFMIMFAVVVAVLLVVSSFAYGQSAVANGHPSAEIIELETVSVQALTVDLSESASALNFGETVNFTVTVNGGAKPYIYVWYLDGQWVQNSSSPYYSTSTQTVGSHHVFVQVTDAEHNSANTLTVEFNILPTSSFSPSLSPTLSPSPSILEFPLSTILVVIASAVLLGALMLKRKKLPRVMKSVRKKVQARNINEVT